MIRKITLLVALVAMLCSFSTKAADLYLVGGVTNWEFHPDMKFTEESPNVYKLKGNIEVFGIFKIASKSWNPEFGAPSKDNAKPELGKPFTLAGKGANTDVNLGDDTYACTEITVEVSADGKSATLTMVGEVKVEELTSVYVIGDNNAWNFMDGSAKLDKIGDGVFKGVVTMAPSKDKDYGYWRIYEGLGQKGTWGTESGKNTDLDPDVMNTNVTSGKLKKGSEGCIVTNAGTYEFTFNINTGEFNLVPFGGVADAASDAVKVVGKRGEIEVSGASDVKVFSMGGALLSDGEARVSVPAGLYIVKAGYRIQKVAVK